LDQRSVVIVGHSGGVKPGVGLAGKRGRRKIVAGDPSSIIFSTGMYTASSKLRRAAAAGGAD